MKKYLVAPVLALAVAMATLVPGTAGGASTWQLDEDTPRIRVDVTTGLLDGQVVHVRGSGLIPGEPIAFFECPGGGACYGGRVGTPDTVADSSGRVMADVHVRRYRGDYMGEEAVDCAYSPCTVRIVRVGNYEDGYEDRAEMPISFARVPNVSPSVTVTPASALPPVASVTIHAAGFAPGARLKFTCHSTVCDPRFPYLVADAAGAASFPLTVTRIEPVTEDCAVTGDCAITVYADASVGASAPFGFAPVPPLAVPRATITRDVLRTDVGAVTVQVTDATPSAPLAVAQCWAGAPDADVCASPTDIVADRHGRVSARIPVTRYLARPGPNDASGAEPPVDCALESCVLRVNGEHALPTETGRVQFVVRSGLPTLRLADATVQEGGPGVRHVRLAATLSRAAPPGVVFDWRTTEDPEIHTVAFPLGARRVILAVPVAGNDQDEPDRTVGIQVMSITGAETRQPSAGGTITVLDDDPTPTLDIGPAIVSEGARYAIVPLHLSSPTARRVEFTYRTIGADARPGEDYVESVGLVDYPWDDLEIGIPIVDDGRVEPTEHFDVEIVAVRGARLGTGRAGVWIGDNDG